MSEGAPRLLARVGGPARDLAFAVTDAACWVAVLRRPGAAGDTVGTFRTACSSVEADAAVEAAHRAQAAQHDGAGGDVGWSIDLEGRKALVSHGTAVDAGLDAAVDPLIARALQTAVAAVRLEPLVVDVPGMGTMLSFTFASLGIETTSLYLDAERLAVTSVSGALLELPTPTLGLVDTDGTLRDGIRAIAELPPGRRAACSLPFSGLDGGDRATAAASGTIALTGPWAADGVQAFAVQAPVQVVPMGALG
ncbi:hypothetical protein [Agromyces salentinus]|uniref:Uncharacterized protein n=1 Tax=Agromyces salentinus TaxID=269421 RepID=A0ABN2N4Q0_9MICO|nr:hypothetical protein [Agromyces salentinus]